MSDPAGALNALRAYVKSQRKQTVVDFLAMAGSVRNIAQINDFITQADERVIDVGIYPLTSLAVTASGVTSQQIMNVSSGEGGDTLWAFTKIYAQLSLAGALMDSDDIAKMAKCAIQINRQYGQAVTIPLGQILNLTQIAGTPGDLTTSAIRMIEVKVPYMVLLPKDTWSVNLINIPAVTSTAALTLDITFEGIRVLLQN